MSISISSKEVFELFKNTDNIIIISHIHPDGDAVGSSLAIFHLLCGLNKNVSVYINDHIPDCFKILPGYNDIKQVPDTNLKVDLIILLDARINRTGGICEKIEAPILNIDHHISNEKKADFFIVDDKASSTCEMLFYMMKKQKYSHYKRNSNVFVYRHSDGYWIF